MEFLDDDLEEINFQNSSRNPLVNDTVMSCSSENYVNSIEISNLVENEETGRLLDDDINKPPAYWEFGYYQQFFDVDTDQVVQRSIWSMIPQIGNATYLQRYIRPNPDFYGPFWITATLIFCVATSANISEFLATNGEHNKIFHFDLHSVTIAATTICIYSTVLPICVWGWMWYKQSSPKYTLLEVSCVYGYSLFIYIPVSALCVIPVHFLQWILVIIAAISSGLVLLTTFWPGVRQERKIIAFASLFVILFFHILLAVGLMLYFFEPSQLHQSSTAIPNSNSSVNQLENSSVKPSFILKQNGVMTFNGLNHSIYFKFKDLNTTHIPNVKSSNTIGFQSF